MVWVLREEETKMSGRGTGNLVCSSTSDPVFIRSILSGQISQIRLGLCRACVAGFLRRAVSHSCLGALRGFVLGTYGVVLLTPRIDTFVATC
jgi:hypothetical protein